MKLFKWVTKDTNINFMGASKFTYILSAITIALSIICISIKGFNYGIDFSGGILIELKSEDKINLENMREELNLVSIDDINIQTIGNDGNEVMIRAQAKELNEKEQMMIVSQIKKILGNSYEYRRIELVGPQVGSELKKAGIIASILAIFAISAYVWFRFEWQFAIGACVGLIHDVITTLGLLSLFGLDFSLTTIAAILTLAGYSINDTVVTYDRIRENLRKFPKMPQLTLLNKSINDIFSRTILTGLTTFLAATSLLIFGGETLRSFSFVIAWGVVIGTFSSIYVSAIMLNLFDLRKTADEKDINPFGNVD